MRNLSLVNWPIVISSALLLSTGILVIYSSSSDLAVQQLIFALVGAVLFFVIARLDYRIFSNLAIPFYLFVLLLLLIVFALDFQTRGSFRWIPLGIFNIQPSEFAKPALILVLAGFWSKNIPTWRNIFKSLLWTLPLAILIFKQPDLGSCLTIMAIWFGMLLAANVTVKKALGLFTLLIIGIPIFFGSLHDYQRQRITSFLVPESDPLGRGYNLIQSTIAVGSGELFGRGLGRGTQSRLQFLPEYRTDFIFASIAEEMGFVGSTLIIFLYFYLITQSIKVSQFSQDFFGHLLVFGVVSMLLFQTFVNIGMNVGLLPITGITLPLLSYGGSSMVTTLISLAFIASVSNFRKRIDTDSLTE